MVRAALSTLSVVLLGCGTKPDLLNGMSEAQFRVDSIDHGIGRNAYFVFTDDGNWDTYVLNRRDSLRLSRYDDVIQDHTYRFHGDSVYFWDYHWDVIGLDEAHMEVQMKGGGQRWYMTRTNYPIIRE